MTVISTERVSVRRGSTSHTRRSSSSRVMTRLGWVAMYVRNSNSRAVREVSFPSSKVSRRLALSRDAPGIRISRSWRGRSGDLRSTASMRASSSRMLNGLTM